MTYGRNLSLFPKKHYRRIDNHRRYKRPKFVICPVCQAIYRMKGGSPTGCSTPCRIQARFWRFVEKTDTCWIWTGSSGGTGAPYGRFSTFGKDGKRYLAHRLSYEILVGPIPEGLTIDHLCQNTLCVRPDHLEAVTMRENLLRSNAFSGVNARKTVCLRGHAYDEANTYRNKKGQRSCRICNRTMQLQRKEAKRLARIVDDGHNDAQTIDQTREDCRLPGDG